MSNLTDLIGYGVAASRPTAGTPGRLYYATDTDTMSRDNGSTWDDLPMASTPALDDLTDVMITSVADGDVLTYDSGTSAWINQAPSGGGSGPAGELGYVAITSSQSTSNSTWTDVPGLSVTVTIGSRPVVVNAYFQYPYNSGGRRGVGWEHGDTRATNSPAGVDRTTRPPGAGS